MRHAFDPDSRRLATPRSDTLLLVLGVYAAIAGAVAGLSFALALAFEWLTTLPPDAGGRTWLVAMAMIVVGVPVAIGSMLLGGTLAVHILLGVTHRLRLHSCDHCGRRLASIRDRCCRTPLTWKEAAHPCDTPSNRCLGARPSRS